MVKWQAHNIEEGRHPQSGRKARHCTICDQYWTGRVGVECPGVPVLHTYSEQYGTKTQLARDRLYPPDEEQPDAAYRVKNAPYYGWLYDRSKAIARPLTSGQIAGNRKREETIRQRYGCRFCSTRYTKQHYVHFQHGTCGTCRDRIRAWNDLLASCQKLKAEDTFVVQVETEEPRSLVKWGSLPALTLTSVEVWPLSVETPAITAETPLKDAYGMLHFYLDSSGLPLLFASAVDQEVVYRWLYPDWNFWENFHFKDFHVLRFSHDLAYPLPEQKDWRVFSDRHDYYQPNAAAGYYRELNDLFGLGMQDPLVPTHVIRQIVLTLADRDPIAFP
ncbi:MAG: hypothetical protein J2P37_00340 [Ktedonobacteraceae bacterium]|nr:hypothetical protein [Ktedonobacteraceae bacterium]